MALLNVGKGVDNGYLMTYYHDLTWALREISNRFPAPPDEEYEECGKLWVFDGTETIENTNEQAKFELFQEIRQAFYTCIISIYQVYNPMHNQTDACLRLFFLELNNEQVTSPRWWNMLKRKQILIQSCVVELFVLVCSMVRQSESYEGTTMARPFPLESFNGQPMHWTQMCKVLPKDNRIAELALKPVADGRRLPGVALSNGRLPPKRFSNGDVSDREPRPLMFLVGEPAEQPTDRHIPELWEEKLWTREHDVVHKKGWCELNRLLHIQGKEPTPLETSPPRARVRDICEWKLTKGTMKFALKLRCCRQPIKRFMVRGGGRGGGGGGGRGGGGRGGGGRGGGGRGGGGGGGRRGFGLEEFVKKPDEGDQTKRTEQPRVSGIEGLEKEFVHSDEESDDEPTAEEEQIFKPPDLEKYQYKYVPHAEREITTENRRGSALRQEAAALAKKAAAALEKEAAAALEQKRQRLEAAALAKEAAALAKEAAALAKEAAAPLEQKQQRLKVLKAKVKKEEDTPEQIVPETPPDAEAIERMRKKAEDDAKAEQAFEKAFPTKRSQERNMYIVFHPGKPEFESEMMFTTAVDKSGDDSGPSDWSAANTDPQNSELNHDDAHEESGLSAAYTDPHQQQGDDAPDERPSHESAGTDEPDISDPEIDEEDIQDPQTHESDAPDNEEIQDAPVIYEEIVQDQLWPGNDWPPKFKRSFPIDQLPVNVKKEDNCPGSAAWNSGVEYIFQNKGKVLDHKFREEILRYCLNQEQVNDNYEYFHIPVDKKYIEWWLTDYVLAKQLEAEDIREGRTYSQRTDEQIARWKNTGLGPSLKEQIQLHYPGEAKVTALKDERQNAGRGARTPAVIQYGPARLRGGPLPAAITHISRARFTLPPACLHDNESVPDATLKAFHTFIYSKSTRFLQYTKPDHIPRATRIMYRFRCWKAFMSLVEQLEMDIDDYLEQTPNADWKDAPKYREYLEVAHGTKNVLLQAADMSSNKYLINDLLNVATPVETKNMYLL